MPSLKNLMYPSPDQPRQLRLDTTTTCNANCVSCHRYNAMRSGNMQFDLIIKILKDVATWPKPLEEIIPVNYGEFFCFPEWAGLLKMIETHLPKTQIVIPTNGALLDNEKVSILCGIHTLKVINFSVNAYYDETYEAFMKLPASNIENIKSCIRKIRVERPDIIQRVSMVFDPMYHSDLERDYFKEAWKELAEPWINTASSACRGTKIVIPRQTPCRSIFSDFVVGYDGKLSSCCFDAGMVLDIGEYSGNLLKDWKNPKMVELRKVHNDYRREEIPLCAGCTFA